MSYYLNLTNEETDFEKARDWGLYPPPISQDSSSGLSTPKWTHLNYHHIRTENISGTPEISIMLSANYYPLPKGTTILPSITID